MISREALIAMELKATVLTLQLLRDATEVRQGARGARRAGQEVLSSKF